MNNPLDFTGRAVLITGGSQGIGRRMAERFLAAGASVMCAADAPRRARPPPVGAPHTMSSPMFAT